MSQQHPLVLYVGEQSYGVAVSATLERCGWYTFIVDETTDALSQYIFNYPDICILDITRQPQVTQQVLGHLQSVGAKPIILLADSRLWDEPPGEETYIVPPEITPDDLMLIVQQALCQQPSDKRKLKT